MKAPYTSRQLIRDCWKYIRPHKTKFLWASFLRLTSDLVWLYPAVALAGVVNFFTQYESGDDLMPFWIIMGVWGAASLYHYVNLEISRYLGYQVSEKVGLETRKKTLNHLLKLDMSWQEKENTGNKLKRIQKGSEGFDEIIRMYFDTGILVVVNFVGVVFVLMVFDFVVASMVLLFIVSFYTFSYFLTKKAALSAHKVNVAEETVQGLAFEMCNHVQTVKAVQLQPSLMGIFGKKLQSLFIKIKYRIWCFRTRGGLLALWGLLFRLGLLVWIGYGITQKQYEVGFLVLFYKYFDMIWESISILSDMTASFIVHKYGIQRMVEILHEPIRVADETGKESFNADWKTLTLEKVNFSYDEVTKKTKKPANKVLKNLSVTVKRGEKIGIVGASGSGKSTFFKLLLKQRENYNGKILFDDQNLKNTKKSDYLKQVAVVLQDTELFNMTLENNILLASENKKGKVQRLKEALGMAHITEFLHTLPKGAKTFIGEKGVKLSGGEKQRLGIARAVYRNPEILLLDEATSHLDIESEKKIQDALHNFFQKVTAIVVAHRLSTIREMDRIVVLEAGTVKELGTFDELIKKKGRFYEMWEQQKFV